MATHTDNKYTVNGKIAALQSRCTAFESDLHSLKAHLLGELQMYLDENCHGMNGKDGAPGRDGVDGVSIVGPKGDAGDITAYGPEELQAAVIGARRKLKEHHAAVIAILIESIEASKRGGPGSHLLSRHLAQIKADIERLPQ
jgi:hypothetical protein